jgi:integrase
MKGVTFRRCGCRDPETGKKYKEGQCPRLLSNKRADRDHGSWWGRFDAPRGADGRRRQPRLGPFATQKEAENAISAEITRLGAGGDIGDKKMLVRDYLQSWLEGKRSLKLTTFESYEEAVRLYFIPALGHQRLCDLREHHIGAMVTAMSQINRPLPEGEKPSELLQRLLEVRADDERRQLEPGEKRHKKSTRPLSPARVKRIMAALDSALNSAVKSKRMDRNPAANVELPRASTVRPLVWTKPRVDRWLAKGKVPGPVMVWTPMQTGAFLDFVMDDRLYPLFHLTAFRGLRRAEVAGLPWAEVDLDQALLTVTETRPDDEYDDPDDPKSEAGTRTISLDPDTVKILKDWRHDQTKERLAAGHGWVDSGLVFTQADGKPLRPDGIYRRFDALVGKYELIRRRHASGKTIAELARRHRVPEAAAQIATIAPLPPIRFHDLRHGAATLPTSYEAGVDIKVVSETLGHSKSSFTRDTYTSVIPEVAQAAAEAVVQVVPRMRQLYQQRQQGRERTLRPPTKYCRFGVWRCLATKR